MNRATVGDLVWIPDRTCCWSAQKAVEISGPLLALIKGVKPLTVLVSLEGDQKELAVHRKDVYDIGDLYD